MMDREEWIYRTLRMELAYLVPVKKFVAAAKKIGINRGAAKKHRLIY
jgi:hypothetical protein